MQLYAALTTTRKYLNPLRFPLSPVCLQELGTEAAADTPGPDGVFPRVLKACAGKLCGIL